MEWRAIEGDDIFQHDGNTYVKQGDMNYIASLGRRKPRKIVVRSVADLLEIVERDVPGDWIFRGHSSHFWTLTAGAHRLSDAAKIPKSDVPSFEKELLTEFKRRARIFLSSPPKSEWEWLVIAQHFGLPTRILDWTENPLVALYFAVRDVDQLSRDGMLFAYRHGAAALDVDSTLDPFSISQIELLRPPHLDQRVIAQQSMFTVEPADLEKGGGRESSDIRYWHVSANHKIAIREQLSKLGVAEGILFPGLPSIAADVKAASMRKILADRVANLKPKTESV